MDELHTLVALALVDYLTGDKLHLAVAAGEVEILTAVHYRRTSGAHMHFLCAVLIQELDCFPHLSASYDTVINEQQFLALDKLVDRDELHLCDHISHTLALGHKASRPGGGVLDKGSCERNSAAVSVADSVGNTRIGNSAYIVNIGETAVFNVCLRHNFAVACSHSFNGHTLVNSGGIAVVCPHKRAEAHILKALCHHLNAISGELYYLTWAELLIGLIAQLLECEMLQRETVTVLTLADDYRQSAQLVAGADDTVLGHNCEVESTLYLVLRIAYTVNEVVLVCDKHAYKGVGVDSTAGERLKACVVHLQQAVEQHIGICDDTHICDSVLS